MIQKLQEDLVYVRQQLSDDLPSVLELRPLPIVAMRLNEECKNYQASLDKIVDLIQSEPATSARVLSIVNSPVYAYSRDIDSIKQAVIVLGFRKLTEVTVSVISREMFTGEGRPTQEGLSLYEHSLACATASRILAQQSADLIDDGAAFMAGLMHDVGKLFLFDLAPDAYLALLEVAGTDCTIDHETRLFGKSHVELGTLFAHRNGLPTSIRSAIQHHHSEDGHQQSRLAQTVDLANSLVKTWKIGGGFDLDYKPNAAAAAWISRNDDSFVEQIHRKSSEQFNTLRSLILD